MGRPRKAPLTELQKIAKKIGDDGEDILRELEAMDTPALEKRIAQANQAIVATKQELEADLPNGEMSPYMRAKGNVSLLGSGLREVKKRQNAIISVAIKLRQERGAV